MSTAVFLEDAEIKGNQFSSLVTTDCLTTDLPNFPFLKTYCSGEGSPPKEAISVNVPLTVSYSEIVFTTAVPTLVS